MRFRLLSSFLFLFFVGCSGVPTKLDSSVFYKRDMKVTFDGKSYSGAAVLPNSPINEITFETKGKLDLLTITTCNREFTAENLSSGLFGKNRYVYRYVPLPGIEDEYCPIDVGGYEAVKGRHSWAYLDRVTIEETVPASLICNGELVPVQGVSICQSKQGLLQRITFQEEVSAAKPDKCPLETIDGKTYQYEIADGVCVYKFKNAEGKLHRHTTLGYEDIVIGAP